MAIMKNNQEPVTRIGDTWRQGGGEGQRGFGETG